MQTHLTSAWKGPVTQDRAWWPRVAVPTTDRIRTELVQRVRQEIAAGTYDTPEKWDAALDRLFDRLDNA